MLQRKMAKMRYLNDGRGNIERRQLKLKGLGAGADIRHAQTLGWDGL
jgi:hypothetical protein